MVRVAGLEPARVAPLPPQSSVSANSTIRAAGQLLNQFNAGVASAFSRHRSWSRDGHGRTSVAPRQPKRAARITAKAPGRRRRNRGRTGFQGLPGRSPPASTRTSVREGLAQDSAEPLRDPLPRSKSRLPTRRRLITLRREQTDHEPLPAFSMSAPGDFFPAGGSPRSGPNGRGAQPGGAMAGGTSDH